MNVWKIVSLAAAIIFMDAAYAAQNQNDTAIDTELEAEIKEILSKNSSGDQKPAPKLGGAEVRQKIDRVLKEIVEKYKKVEDADPKNKLLKQIGDILLNAYQLSELFMASHQFLEAEKFIVDQAIDRLQKSVEHIENIAAAQEALDKLSGQESEPTRKKRKTEIN